MYAYHSVTVGASHDWDVVGASLAYYVLNVCAVLFGLCAIAQLCWPLAFPKLCMAKLTDKETSQRVS